MPFKNLVLTIDFKIMRKLLLILAISCYSLHSQATTTVKPDTVKKDTAKIIKQIRKLNGKLADLKTELSSLLNQIPVDSIKCQLAVSKSHDLFVKSKKAANNALGGDARDAKKAEKQAEKALDAGYEAIDATKQLEKDHKKVNSLTKDIAKTQEKLVKLQAQ